MIRKRLAWFVLATILCAGSFVAGAFMPRDDDFFAIRKSFEIYGAVYEELVTNYVDRVEPERLMRAGIDAMLGELDPYTVFFDEADNTDMDIITRGSYGGVGLNVGVRNGRITVVAPIEGASGYKQGVRAGDVILRVGDRSTNDLSLRDVQTLMRGEPGTTVGMEVEREGSPETIEFVLTRERVKLSNVAYSGFLPGTSFGYVKLERFAHGAGREVREAISSLQADQQLTGLILDLRDNPGGLLDAAVEISELFVPQGAVIVSTNGRQPETKRTYASRRRPLVTDKPLVVLTNQLSASASEIVAGAVQDLDRGVIVGKTTFGKGLVQVVRGLPYNTSLKLTASRYFTPAGRSIQSKAYRFGHDPTRVAADTAGVEFRTAAGRRVRAGFGIEPDVQVDDRSSPLEEALVRRAAFFFFANYYAGSHQPVAEDFVPDNELVAEFRSWLREQRFDFELPGERELEAISRELDPLLPDEVEGELDDVLQAVRSSKEESFITNRDRIREHLRAEIVSRYHGDHAQIRSSLASDDYIRAAVRVLSDVNEYRALLSPE